MRPLPNEIMVMIFQAATFVPYEFDATGDDLQAARAHLLPDEITEPALRAAIMCRLQISLVSKEWSAEWVKYLYQTIIIGTAAHLESVVRTLNIDRRLQQFVRRIDVSGIPFTGVRRLRFYTPRLQTYRIAGDGIGRFKWDAPLLECISLDVYTFSWPQLMRAQTIRIIDLSGMRFASRPADFRTMPDLPHLYAVGMRLDQWCDLSQLRNINGSRFRILYLRWRVDVTNRSDFSRYYSYWALVQLTGWHEDCRLHNLTHLITTMIPTNNHFMQTFPGLQTIEVPYSDECLQINPYRECLWKWRNPPKHIHITHIPLRHSEASQTEGFESYHRSLMAFVHVHLTNFSETFFFVLKFFGQRGNELSYVDLINLWERFVDVPEDLGRLAKEWGLQDRSESDRKHLSVAEGVNQACI